MSFRSRTRGSGDFLCSRLSRRASNGSSSAMSPSSSLGFFAGLRAWMALWRSWPLVPIEVVGNFFVWQLATYLFLHGGFGHIIWNMLALWMFGADIESVWGTRRFLQFYFFCGIGAGICVVLANFLLPWGNPLVPTIGSSGAIFGILLAYAMMYPDRTILWGFLIPIKVKYFVTDHRRDRFPELVPGEHRGQRIRTSRRAAVRLSFHEGAQNAVRPGWLLVRGSITNGGLRRAKRKFQVYLRKQGSGRDPRVH